MFSLGNNKKRPLFFIFGPLFPINNEMRTFYIENNLKTIDI